MTPAPGRVPWTGRPSRRVEDAHLLTGAGCFVDDIALPGMLHLVAVRSPHAHAGVARIDLSAARQWPGVRAAVSLADLGGLGRLPIMTDNGAQAAPVPIPVLAGERVRFVGEPVAAVLAESRAAAVDAAELVDVDYEEMPAVVDPREALTAQVVLHPEAPDNVLFRWQQGSGDTGGAFAAADRVVHAVLELPRLAAAPIEPRGAVVTYDSDADLLTVYASAQDPHRPRAQLAGMLSRPAESIRVVVRDVGGSFGSKSILPPEAFVAAALSIRLGVPVKFIESRSENFLAAYQGRGQRAECELAVDARGRFLALRARLVADVGAYLYPATTVPPVLAGSLLTGVYDIPAASVEVLGVATNKVPTGPYRGAGRPEGAYISERLAELTAAELGLDRAEIRRRNLIQPAAFPYRTAVGTTVDSGDFPMLLRRACELLDYDGAITVQRQAQARGEVQGTGLSVFLEPAGLGFWESAAVSVQPGGQVIAQIGSSPHGQGHQTAFAQLLADALDLNPGQVEIRFGDTGQAPAGVGTFASRSAIVGGSALVAAAAKLREMARDRAAATLGLPADQVSWQEGRLVGASQIIELGDLAAGGEPLTATATFRLTGPVYSSGAYGMRIAIDTDTGLLSVLKLVAVHDVGRVLNPLLAEGQVAGATLQGFAEAVSEQVVYADDGQLINGSFLGYGILSAAEAPELHSEFAEIPSPLNPLGVKGVGETGTTGMPAAMASAVADALAPFGIRHLDPPYTPQRLHEAMSRVGAVQSSPLEARR
ncbi:MAG TPA: xanthine dehydrogenase family protein molybdopterin-binding subunit [Streptosporangiaceae bacterium]|nr:xanthine dehydrogenase family protein molybdopterin-binding subunit [Streptosporangiaceae bacterium]